MNDGGTVDNRYTSVDAGIWVLKDRDGQSGLIGFCHEVDRQRSLESSVAFPTDLSCSPCSMRPDPVM